MSGPLPWTVGPDFPIMIKLGLKDYHPDGKSLSDGIDTAKALETDGIDAIEVSEGFEKESAHHIRKDAIAPYYLEECRKARQVMNVSCYPRENALSVFCRKF
ncbi:MAG: hypothetical protein JW976_14660 [Syntrophaceae bacterium]|nr:hypothetical protein [Syntrophaceae bacterium]